MPRRLRGLLAEVGRNRGEAAAAKRNRARGTHCFYCGVRFGDGPLTRTVDHRVPRGAGGNEGLVNMVFACRACNERKADSPEDVFTTSVWLADRRAAVEAARLGEG